MNQLFEPLFALVVLGVIEFWAFADSDHDPRLALPRAASIDDAIEALPSIANYANAYGADVGLNLFRRHAVMSAEPSRELPGVAVCVEFMFSSYEGGEAACRERLGAFPLEPSAVLAHSDRLYAIWLLDRPHSPTDILGLARLVGIALRGKKASGRPCRSIVLRLANRAGGGDGFVIRIESVHPQRRYDASEFYPYVKATPQARETQPGPSSELGRIAAQYIAAGLPVVPVQPREKRPWFDEWQNRILTELDVIRIWSAVPDANVGLICGSTGWVALDCDGEAHREWVAQNLPPTPFRTISGSGNGGHFVYRWHVGVPIRKRAQVRIPGLTIRPGAHEGISLLGDGSQFVMPGSIHPSGGRYQWADGDPLANLDRVPAFDLTWLPAPAPRATAHTISHHSSACTGRGDYATLDAARLFAAHGLYLRPLVGGKHAVKCPWSGELAGLLCLFAVAVGAARVWAVEIRPGYIEPLNVYVVIVLPPANRKSAVFRLVTDPIRKYEALLVEEARPRIEKAKIEREIKQRKLDRLKANAAGKKGGDPEHAAEEAEQLSQGLAEEKVEVLPQLLVDDVTPERLATIASQQHEKIAMASAEGGIFDIIADLKLTKKPR